MPSKPAFVLVHGAWGGAWIWRRVLAPLREAGHEVHAVTLTGVGERAHLLHEGIRMSTHVADVLGLVAAEELQNIVLVGHSYGGAVITAAADRLQAHGARPLKLHGLVYVDAMVPLPGEGWGSRHSPEVRTQRKAVAAAHGGALPPADAAGFGLSGADRDWLNRRQVPQPFGMYEEPIEFDAARWQALPRTFIDCVQPAYPTIAEARSRARSQPGWQLRVMQTGHAPMVSEPAALVQLLLEAAR